MKKIYSLFLIATILMLPFLLKGQFSKQQAEDLVLNQVLVDDTGYINVYCSFSSIHDTNMIFLADGDTIPPPFQDNWVFF